MKYTYYEGAWMEDILGEIWFREHFVKCCGTERPQVLILDSHSSHETLGHLEAAKKEGIHLFAFLSQTTQWLEEKLCFPTATSMTIDARFLIEALKHGDIAISQAGDRYEIQVTEFDIPMDEKSIAGSP